MVRSNAFDPAEPIVGRSVGAIEAAGDASDACCCKPFDSLGCQERCRRRRDGHASPFPIRIESDW